jgi:hypothetical protein
MTMNTRKNVFYLALPLILLGCQQAMPGRLGGSATSSSVTLAETARTEVPPTVESTLTAPEAKGAVIAPQAEAIADRPPQFGGLVLNIKWPDRLPSTRNTQAIPKSANSLWIKVYSGTSIGTGASQGQAAPSGSVIASRVVGRNTTDNLPGPTPTPNCCGPQDTSKKIYLSLPPGGVSVWVGTFAEEPEQVSTGSVYLTSGITTATITANQLGSPKSLDLVANQAIAPAIVSSPEYVVPGAEFTLQGSNFFPDDMKVSLVNGQCCPTSLDLTLVSASTTSVTAKVPTDATSRKYQVQVETNGFTAKSGDVAVLNSQGGIGMTFTNTKQYWTGTANENAAVRTSRVALSSLVGYVCCNNESYELPRDIVTIKTPSGGTTVLDASGSFLVDSFGKYDVTAKIGALSSTFKLAGYDASFNIQAGTCDGCNVGQNQNYLLLGLGTILGQTIDQTKLTASVPFFARLVGQDGEPAFSNQYLNNDDFTFTGSSGVSVSKSTREITPTAAGTASVTATFKGSAQTAKFDLNVLQPTSAEFVQSQPSMFRNSFANFSAQVKFTAPGTSFNKKVGQNNEFTWTVSDSNLATVTDGSVQSKNATGSFEIKAETKIGNPKLSATMSVKVQE